jgi:hypothetical protein
MHRVTKHAVSIGLAAVMVLMFWPLQAMPPAAHATSIQVSTVYISPVDTCCGAPNTTYALYSTFSVNVSLDLASGESVNAFDVRINYTNPYSPSSPHPVLQATSIDYTTDLFSDYGYSPTVLTECIDGSQIAGATPCASDVLGQVHLSLGIIGTGITGPVQGPLFTILFTVRGMGNSTFLVDTANLADPNPDFSNPTDSAHYIPVFKNAGVFANTGVTAFFNYQPLDTTVSQSILPNEQVVFDATASFVPGNSSDLIRLYSWNFGDGKQQQNETTAQINHIFKSPGNYTVSLKVWDEKNITGVFARQVPVFPALGSIALIVRNQVGAVLDTNVVIKVFNNTSSPSPFANQTISISGITQFNQLVPGHYFVVFTGQGYYSANKTEQVLPAWTTQDSVYLSAIPPPPNAPDYSGIVYGGTFAAGLGIISAAIIIRKRKSSSRTGKKR